MEQSKEVKTPERAKGDRTDQNVLDDVAQCLSDNPPKYKPLTKNECYKKYCRDFFYNTPLLSYIESNSTLHYQAYLLSVRFSELGREILKVLPIWVKRILRHFI